MEKLVSTSQAAHILGISLQGVHYRIKTGKLKSEKKDGKTFVYVDDKIKSSKKDKHNQTSQDIVSVKDEHILFLNKTIKWMKKHYKQEIKRLETNQKEIIKVFKSEINLLQSAFNEMRSIYQIEHKNTQNSTDDIDFEIMDIKDFFLFMKQNNKTDSQIKSLILQRVKEGDKRFVYNKETKQIIIYKSDFIDLI
jgi:hypothetical protein